MTGALMPALNFRDLMSRLPIIQGGMSIGVSLSGLAAAVANAGGIGVIGTAGIGMMEPNFRANYQEANIRALRREIRTARSMTDGVLGVNVMQALSDWGSLVCTAVEEAIDVIFIGAGLPLKLPMDMTVETLRELKTKIVPIVSSARAAKIILKYWDKNFGRVPDGLVVEGPLAGGHLGFHKTDIKNPEMNLDKLVPDVIQTVESFGYFREVPVIAAGGIYTGADIRRYLNMGAAGVQMATRFVATHECDASIKFKEAYVNCTEDDIVIIDSPVGLPGRAVGNDFLTSVSQGEKKPINCPWKCLVTCDYHKAPYCIAMALMNAKTGNLENGFCFAGANAHRVDRIMSVKELMNELVDEYAATAPKNSELPELTEATAK